LLPFLLWIGAEDHGDDTNLIVDCLAKGQLRVRAIDFEDAFKWTQGGDFSVVFPPPGLISNLELELVDKTLAGIKKLTAAEITSCCNESGLSTEPARQFAAMLIQRQHLLPRYLLEHGWTAK
jgi:hypothetical protein